MRSAAELVFLSLTLDLSPGVRLCSMKIGQVAKDAGVRVDTLRYYERRGLLDEPERRPSGYREYGADAAQLVRFIKRAQDLGFTLKQIQELLRLRRGGRSNRTVRAIAETKLQDIEAKIARLHSMRRALAGLVEVCSCPNASSTPTCPIIEALDDPRPDVPLRAARRAGARS